MPFPDVIYNAGSPEKLSVSKEIIDRLKRRYHLQLIQSGTNGM